MNPFDPEGAAQGLRSAMRGLGTDEDAIIKIIALHTNKQRQDIKLKYRTMFGRVCIICNYSAVFVKLSVYGLINSLISYITHTNAFF